MDKQNLLTLFFIDSQGNENYGLALVPGEYLAQPEAETKRAYLIIFMCVNCESAFSFYYVDYSGNYIGHSPLHSGEESIDYVLLEAWLKFDVLPHYWILAEETEHSSVVCKHPESDYTETYLRLKEVLSRFRWAESTKSKALDKSPRSSLENLQKYNSNRLFYPDLPSEILAPLTL